MKMIFRSIVCVLLLFSKDLLAKGDTLRLADFESTSLYWKSSVFTIDSKKSIEYIRQNAIWKPLKSDFKAADNQAIWIRFFVENTLDTSQKLFIRNPDNEVSEYFFFENNKLSRTLVNGDFSSTWEMNEHQVVGVDYFNIAPHSTIEVYIKASNFDGFLSNFRLFPQKSIRTSYYIKNEIAQSLWLNSYYLHNLHELQIRVFYQGGLGVIFIIMLLVSYRNRGEKLYQYYLFYVFSAFVFTLIKSRSFTYVGKLVGIFPTLKIYGGESILWIGFAVYLIFVAELLDLRPNHQKLYSLIRRVCIIFSIYGVGIFVWLFLTNDSGLQSKLFIISRIPLVSIYVGFLAFTARKIKSSMVPYVLLSNSVLIIFGMVAWLKAGFFNQQVWPGVLNHLFTLPFAILLEIVVFALAVAKKISTDRIQKNELEKKAIETEMLALRSQMNPHFIFNSLNSIRYFVLTNDKENAKNYISKFSYLLRNILQYSRQDTITLEEELETLRIYLEIESARFDAGFRYEIIVDEKIELAEILIPPMILQPFVENAIVHGLLNSQKEQKILKIKVSEEQKNILITISDNGIGRKESEKRKNTNSNQSFGTTITNQRIALFNKNYHSKIQNETIDFKDGTEVIIKILNQIQ